MAKNGNKLFGGIEEFLAWAGFFCSPFPSSKTTVNDCNWKNGTKVSHFLLPIPAERDAAARARLRRQLDQKQMYSRSG